MRERPRAASLVIAALYSLFALQVGAFGQEAERAAAHTGAVLALMPDISKERVLSVGEDGFLVEWDGATRRAASRFQLSPYAASSIALSPDGANLAIAETDGLGLYRVSAWKLKARQKLFTLRFKDRVSYLAYSAGGSFLIVTREGREGVSLINAENGMVLTIPQEIAGPISFAATGKSDRTMITYSSVGLLSYWDLGSGRELKRVDAPAALASPTLFGNNRYFGGLDARGLVIIDALSGSKLARPSVANGAFIVSPSESSSSVFVIGVNGNVVIIQEVTIADKEGQIQTPQTKSIALPAPASSASMVGTTILIGMRDGKIAAFDTQSGEVTAYEARRRIRLNDAAVSKSMLLGLADRGRFLFPSNPDDFINGSAMSPIRSRGEDRVVSLAPLDNAAAGGDRFLLWRADGSLQPIVYQSAGASLGLAVPTGVPFRSASVDGDRALLLDATGAITIVSLLTGEVRFSFASLGLLDAVLSGGRIIAGKSRGVAPRVPLLTIDSETGETAPIDIKGTAVVRLHRGTSGMLYAIVADTDSSGPKTSIVELDISATGGPQVTPIVEYRSEDVDASIAETSASIATTLGGDGATLVKPSQVIPFERTDALPLRLTDGGNYFIVVDTDGGICWHDPLTGAAKAVLRLYDDGWELEREGTRIGGPIK